MDPAGSLDINIPLREAVIRVPLALISVLTPAIKFEHSLLPFNDQSALTVNITFSLALSWPGRDVQR